MMKMKMRGGLIGKYSSTDAQPSIKVRKVQRKSVAMNKEATTARGSDPSWIIGGKSNTLITVIVPLFILHMKEGNTA